MDVIFSGLFNLDNPKAEYFARREFSVTLLNDTCIRYMSFPNAEEMMMKFSKMVPAKIDIGAIYSSSVTLSLSSHSSPLIRKWLLFLLSNLLKRSL
jgi:hypothetical protein